jgi:hypothetical protein
VRSVYPCANGNTITGEWNYYFRFLYLDLIMKFILLILRNNGIYRLLYRHLHEVDNFKLSGWLGSTTVPLGEHKRGGRGCCCCCWLMCGWTQWNYCKYSQSKSTVVFLYVNVEWCLMCVRRCASCTTAECRTLSNLQRRTNWLYLKRLAILNIMKRHHEVHTPRKL